MCHIWKREIKKEMTVLEWKKTLNDSVFREIRDLTVSGGEIFLLPNLYEYIKVFIDKLPKLKRLTLNTNGFLTEKIVADVREIAIICKKKGVKLTISISIDGKGAVHNEIRGIKDGFERAEKTLNELKKINTNLNFKISIASLLLKNNIENFGETKKWLESTGVNFSFQIVGFHETFVNNLETEKMVGFGKDSQVTLIKVLDELSQNKGSFDLEQYYWSDLKNMHKNGKNRTTPCPFLKDNFVIDSLGDVYYCLSVKPIGNFLKEKRGVGEIYFDSKNIKFRKQLPLDKCKNCNSGCDAMRVLAFDFKRAAWYKLSGKLWKQGPINR